MTTLEIILSIMLCIITVLGLYIIIFYRNFNDEILSNLIDNRNSIKSLAEEGVFDAILDVDMFNEWFNSKKDPQIYAHSGIFLRIDKLSGHHFKDYIKMKTGGAISWEDFDCKQQRDFEVRVEQDWRKKINNY